MTTQIKRRRGTTVEHASFTGAEGEITIDTTKDTVVVHDGSTVGGHPLAKEDGSTFTNVDINSGTIDGTVIGGASAAAGTFTTVTGTSFVSSGDMTFGDNDKAIFGAGSDLQIYHDGSDSYISDTGTGRLNIQSGTSIVIEGSNGDNFFSAVENGSAAVYYDNTVKLETTATGIDVTGTVTADGLTVDNQNVGGGITIQGSNAPALTLSDTTDSGYAKVGTQNGGDLNLQADPDNLASGTNFAVFLDGKKGLQLAEGNDISFYEDTGTTPKLFWDASAESLGIGTTSPSQKLEVTGNIKTVGVQNIIQNANASYALWQDGTPTKAWRMSLASGYNNLFFDYYNGTSWANTVTFDASGNLGLGVTPSASTLTTFEMPRGVTLNANTGIASMILGANAHFNAGWVYKTSTQATFYRQQSGAHEWHTAPSGTAGNAITFTQAMTLDASGRLGIGTTSPISDAQLTVAGSSDVAIAFQRSGSSFESAILATSGALTFKGGSDSSTVAGLSEFMRISSVGNVGIGTTSPTAKLTLGNNTETGEIATSFYNSSATGFVGLEGSSGNRFVGSSTNNMFIGTATSDGLELATNNNVRMVITSAGNVGIGTTSPSELLDVYSASTNARVQIQTNNSSSVPQIELRNTAAGCQIGMPANVNAMTFTTADNERMRIDSSGNVGIGTTSPTNKLYVKGSGNYDGVVAIDNGTTTGGGILSIKQNGVTSGFFSTNGSAQGDTGTDLALFGETGNAITFFTNGTGTERLRIDTNGNVGIGTTSPSELLTVAGRGLFTRSSSNTLTVQSTGGGAYLNLDGDNGDNTIGFYNGYARFYDFTNNTERMRIDSSGNVGIGTTSPAVVSGFVTLDVRGSTNGGFIQASTGTETVSIYNSSGASFAGSQTNNAFGLITNGTERMRIDSSGNLLVGTTSSGFNGQGLPLVVGSGSGNTGMTIYSGSTGYGAIQFADAVSTGADSYRGVISYKHGDEFMYFSTNATERMRIDSSGMILPGADDAQDLGSLTKRYDDVYATNALIQTSDRNEKQDIEALSEAEQRVAVAAKGLLRKFRWKSKVAEKGDDARIHFGIIAQDLQAAFEAEGLDAGRYAMFIHSTWTDEETGEERSRMGVRYSELLAFIISAI